MTNKIEIELNWIVFIRRNKENATHGSEDIEQRGTDANRCKYELCIFTEKQQKMGKAQGEVKQEGREEKMCMCWVDKIRWISRIERIEATLKSQNFLSRSYVLSEKVPNADHSKLKIVKDAIFYCTQKHSDSYLSIRRSTSQLTLNDIWERNQCLWYFAFIDYDMQYETTHTGLSLTTI